MAARNSHTHGVQVSSGFAPVPTVGQPMAPSAYPSGPGADPYQGQRFDGPLAGSGAYARQPTGWDFSSPGVAEQTFMAQQGRYMDPGMSRGVITDAMGAFSSPGYGEDYWQSVAPTASNKSFSEQLAGNPSLDQYYDRAREQAMGALNDQFAARGAYGSSAATSRMGQVLADLGAEQANREAEYARTVAGQADASRMARLQGLGALANQAQELAMGRTRSGIDAALGYDQMDLARLQALMGGASMAQDARRARGRDYMSDLSNAQNRTLDWYNQGMSRLLGVDEAMLDSQISAMLGMSDEALAQAQKEYERMMQGLGLITQAGGAVAQAVP